MKFGKLLTRSAEGLPEEQAALFLRYKDLKKQLKLIKPAESLQDGGEEAQEALAELQRQASGGSLSRSPATDQAALSAEEQAFVETLNQDLSKFNAFFMDKEEDCVIQTKSLEDAQSSACSTEGRAELRAKFVNLHGEIVLLLHWSLLNYAAVLKILKKHDKRTGTSLRAPYTEKMLHQPFVSTETLVSLLNTAEQHIQSLSDGDAMAEDQPAAGSRPAASPAVDIPRSEAAAAAASPQGTPQDSVLRRTQAALHMWQEMREKASTPSTVVPLPDALLAHGSPAKRARVEMQEAC